MILWLLYIFIFVVLLRLLLRLDVKRCMSNVDMTGKVVIVTGANNGIGFYTAQDLARRGARVIMACRSEAKATHARDQIIADTGNTNVVYKHLDMASLHSVRKFCDDITRNEQRLDVLVNNAGVYALGDRCTEDGIVEVMQVNYFSVFLLTNLLLPMIKATRGRIVNVGSLLHYFGCFQPDRINKKGYYSEPRAYANSKFCMMAFTVELARRLQRTGVTVNAVHPGAVRTNITDENKNYLIELGFWLAVWVCYRTAEEGAQGVVYACVSEECAAVSGKYLMDCSVWPCHWKCESEKVGLDLWNLSKNMLKSKPTDMKENLEI